MAAKGMKTHAWDPVPTMVEMAARRDGVTATIGDAGVSLAALRGWPPWQSRTRTKTRGPDSNPDPEEDEGILVVAGMRRFSTAVTRSLNLWRSCQRGW